MVTQQFFSTHGNAHLCPQVNYVYDSLATGIDGTGFYRPLSVNDLTVVTITGGYVSTSSPIASSVSNSNVSGSNGTILLANALRKSFFIQNLGTGNNVLYVKYGAGASSSTFNMVLKPGTVNDDGLGGIVNESSW